MPLESLPESVAFGLHLLFGRVRWYVDAEFTQACEGTVHGLLNLPFHVLELDAQIVNVGRFYFALGARQELRKHRLCSLEVSR